MLVTKVDSNSGNWLRDSVNTYTIDSLEVAVESIMDGHAIVYVSFFKDDDYPAAQQPRVEFVFTRPRLGVLHLNEGHRNSIRRELYDHLAALDPAGAKAFYFRDAALSLETLAEEDRWLTLERAGVLQQEYPQ